MLKIKTWSLNRFSLHLILLTWTRPMSTMKWSKSLSLSLFKIQSKATRQGVITRVATLCIFSVAHMWHQNSIVNDSWTKHMNHKTGHSRKHGLKGMKSCLVKIQLKIFPPKFSLWYFHKFFFTQVESIVVWAYQRFNDFLFVPILFIW